jgi:hypothetical protein
MFLIIVLIFKNSVNMVSKIILQLGMFSKINFAKSSQNKSLSLRMEACNKKRCQNWVFLDLRLDYMQTHSLGIQYLKLILIRLVSRNSIFYNLEL